MKNNTKKFLVNVLWGMVAIGCCVVVAFALVDGLNKNEIVECNTWQSQSKEYRLFKLAKWQDEQCRRHNIIINAPIYGTGETE